MAEQNLREVSKKIQDAYERIAFWKRNLFVLPTGTTAKKYVTETTKQINNRTNYSPYKDIAFKTIHIMHNLLLQTSSKSSKAKDHLKVLEKIIDLWRNGKIDELYLRAKQFSHVYIISTHQKVNYLKSLLY